METLRGLRGCSGCTLGSQPREPGFDSPAEWEKMGDFSNTPRPCPPSSEWVPGINLGLCPVSWAPRLWLARSVIACASAIMVQTRCVFESYSDR